MKINEVELKFRAWEKELKEMIPVEDISFELRQINTTSAWRLFEEVELMQYTGLKDKNGVEIYEGDKVKLGGIVYKVGYLDAGFKMISRGAVTRLSGHCEVIGNIHEDEDRE